MIYIKGVKLSVSCVSVTFFFTILTVHMTCRPHSVYATLDAALDVVKIGTCILYYY